MFLAIQVTNLICTGSHWLMDIFSSAKIKTQIVHPIPKLTKSNSMPVGYNSTSFVNLTT